MSELDARQSGSFSIGGDLPVTRLGYGAMRITGDGIWGEPKDRDAAVATLKRLPEIGVNFIDTAESYGPYVSERLIGEVFGGKGDVVIATKSGLTRTGPGVWPPLGRPEFLRQGVLTSTMRLKVERIDLWQLHRIDSKVPRDEQFDAIKSFLSEGLIRHAGLSEVTVEEIEAAQKFFPVATVQNHYNLTTRKSEDVLDYCEKNNIGFIPWFPLAGGELAKPGSRFDAIAKKYDASPSQIALAWVLKRSPVMLPIPGTGKVNHLEENVVAAAIALSDEDFTELDTIGRQAA